MNVSPKVDSDECAGKVGPRSRNHFHASSLRRSHTVKLLTSL